MWRQGKLNVALAGLIVAPLAWIAVTSYGDNIVTRAYYFALPFLAFFAAIAILMAARRSIVLSVLVTTVASAVLGCGLLLTYYGSEPRNYIPADEVRAVSSLTASAPQGSLLIMGETDPIRYRDYAKFVYMQNPPQLQRPTPAVHPLTPVLRLMHGHFPASYLLMTHTSYEYLRLTDRGAAINFERIEEEAARSPLLTIVLKSRDAVIFKMSKPDQP